MERRGMNRLNSLLFEGEEELINVNFFPASSENLTREQFADAAADMIEAASEAWASGKPSMPPETNVRKTCILG